MTGQVKRAYLAGSQETVRVGKAEKNVYWDECE